MSNPKYKQRGFSKQLSKVIEECGECLAAAGKTQRWGIASYNPELPSCEQESNFNWLRRELRDVKEAIDDLDETMQKEFGVEPL